MNVYYKEMLKSCMNYCNLSNDDYCCYMNLLITDNVINTCTNSCNNICWANIGCIEHVRKVLTSRYE